ncbi:hypothetical protein M8J77_019568 [Diaphorina citri]|nr:hypothetical protein M8J77_019568 [Diaphorina citri]
MFAYNVNRIAFTRFITNDIVCLLLPKAPQVSPLKTVLLSFDWPVWVGLAVTFGVVVSLYYLWHCTLRELFPWKKGISPESSYYRPKSPGLDSIILLELYRTMLSLPSSSILPLSSDHRVLLAFLYGFSFIVTNAFQGSLFTFISTPVYYPDVNTFAELDHSGLPLWTSSSGWDELFIEDPHLENLAKRIIRHNESSIRASASHFAGFQRINTHSRGLLRNIIQIRNARNVTRHLHVMRETLITYFISYVLLTESPYRNRIDQLLSYIDEAGLVQKWMTKMNRSLLARFTPLGHTVEKSANIFKLDDLRAPFMLLFAGLIISWVALAGELVVDRWRRHTKLRNLIGIVRDRRGRGHTRPSLRIG